MSSSPIADLTYRGYDGPMTGSDKRWWAIAKMTMLMALKRKGFWVWSVLSAYWYVILMVILYFIDVGAGALGPGHGGMLDRVVWKDTVITAFSHAQLLYFILAMLIGVGQIAEDNRANALLIYLSKPCTKSDYLFGKWLGVFIPLYLIAFLPSLFYWGYLVMSFKDYGAFSSAPWLPVQLVFLAAIPSALLASVSLGVSSLFNQSRWASASFAGFYFIPYFFTLMMWALQNAPNLKHVSLVRDLYYGSMDGLAIGLGKLLFSTDGSDMFNRGNGAIVERPDAWFVILGYVALCGFSMLVAWARIRPVEVVG